MAHFLGVAHLFAIAPVAVFTLATGTGTGPFFEAPLEIVEAPACGAG